MTEQTAVTPPQQSEASLIERIGNIIEPPKAKSAPEQTDQSVQTEEPDDYVPEELTPEDIQDEAAPMPEGEFVLKHNGQELKLPREQALELAEKGFDYTQKTQALAQERRSLQERAELIDHMHAMLPQVAHARATLGNLAAAIQQMDAHIAKTAQDDPVAAFQVKLQRDQAVEQYQMARQQHDSLYGQFQQAQAVIKQRVVQAELPKLLEKIPSWRDPAKLEAERTLIRGHLVSEGFSEQEIGALMDARMVAVARKAALYDQLVRSKGSKKMADLPPVNRPNAPMTHMQKRQVERVEYKKALRNAKTEGDAAKLIQKRLERLV